MTDAFACLLALSAVVPGVAATSEVACATPMPDRNVFFGDSIELETRRGALVSLHRIAGQSVQHAQDEDHAFECEVTVDAQSFAIKRTRSGSVAVDGNDATCRFELVGSGNRLALLPRCRSGCQTSGRYHAM